MHCVHTAHLQTKNLSQPKGAWGCPTVLPQGDGEPFAKLREGSRGTGLAWRQQAMARMHSSCHDWAWGEPHHQPQAGLVSSTLQRTPPSNPA